MRENPDRGKKKKKKTFSLFSGNITEVKQLMKEVKVDCIGDVSTGKTLLKNIQLQKLASKNNG